MSVLAAVLTALALVVLLEVATCGSDRRLARWWARAWTDLCRGYDVLEDRMRPWETASGRRPTPPPTVCASGTDDAAVGCRRYGDRTRSRHGR